VIQEQEYLALKLARLKAAEEFTPVHDGLTFVFAKGGTGKCVTQTSTQTLASGDILVLNGSSGGKVSVQDKKSEFLFWNFSLCFENLLPLFSGNEISLLHQITESYQAAKIYPAGNPQIAECHRLLAMVPPKVNLDHRGQLLRIASAILAMEFEDAQNRRSGFGRAEEHMVEVFEKLSGSEIINLSVGDLAKKFSCSRRHLNRLFHNHFGVSVAALRMEMRLLKAMSLLRDPDAKVISVAEQCGFNHLGLFNTCFKRRFGTSPGQWRKNTVNAEGKAATKQPDIEPTCPLHATGLCPWGGPLAAQPAPGQAPSAGAKSDAKARPQSELHRAAMLGIIPAPPNPKQNPRKTKFGR
jgi:AraC-like DNA-binding protein